MECSNPKRIYVPDSYGQQILQLVPCGKCYGCQSKNRTEWTYRIEKECLNKRCVFVTLTYSDEQAHFISPQSAMRLKQIGENVSKYTLLDKSDVSRFLKACQRSIKQYLGKDALYRYVIVGEYGDNTKRAHYHCLMIFPENTSFNDYVKICKEFWKFPHEYTDKRYNSQSEIPPVSNDAVWSYGHIIPQYVYEHEGVANYVNKHCVKSCTGTRTQQSMAPNFRMTSRYLGGIGVNQIASDPSVRAAYDSQQCLTTSAQDGKVYKLSIPRAVVRRFHPQKLEDWELLEHSNAAVSHETSKVGMWLFTENQPYIDDTTNRRRFYNHVASQHRHLREKYEHIRLAKKKQRGSKN